MKTELNNNDIEFVKKTYKLMIKYGIERVLYDYGEFGVDKMLYHIEQLNNENNLSILIDL